jgi:hypothetical protein
MSEENKNQPGHDSPQEAEPKTKQDQVLSAQELDKVAGGKGPDSLGNTDVQTLMSKYNGT